MRVEIGRHGVEFDIVAYHAPRAKVDACGVLQETAALEDAVFADVDVVAVLAFEGRFDNGAVFDGAFGADLAGVRCGS